MRLGIFGDSFANNQWVFNGWPTDLSNILGCKQDNYALNGTSIWYSYKLFLKHYKNFTHIVFVYTSPHRWPVLPDWLRGLEYMTNKHFLEMSKVIHEDQKIPMTKLIDVHKLLFDEKYNYFVYQSIFDNINNLCAQNNIQLMNVHPFENSDSIPMINLSNRKGSCLIGLQRVQHNEGLHPALPEEIRYPKPTITDFRPAHINLPNNKVVADIIANEFGKEPRVIDILKDERLTFDPQVLIEMYQTYVSKHRR
jgi:hypothetical protein